jgi:hypothetical protein
VDAIKLLKTQHIEVKGLFKRYKSREDEGEKYGLFEKIADDLAAHSAIEERIFYPAVYVGELTSMLKEAVEEHLAAKRTLAELLKMDASDENFGAKMKVLQDQIEHHIEEEEGRLFKKVHLYLDKQELDALGEQMEAMFAINRSWMPLANRWRRYSRS